MTQISFVQRAPQGTRFNRGCFDHQIGELVPFNMGTDTILATLLGAEVLPSGEGVEIKLDVPDEQFSVLRPAHSLSLADEGDA